MAKKEKNKTNSGSNFIFLLQSVSIQKKRFPQKGVLYTYIEFATFPLFTFRRHGLFSINFIYLFFPVDLARDFKYSQHVLSPIYINTSITISRYVLVGNIIHKLLYYSWNRPHAYHTHLAHGNPHNFLVYHSAKSAFIRNYP